MKANIQIGPFIIELPETVDPIKKYQFVEIGLNYYKKGFTELRPLGKFKWAIRHDMSKTWTVSNIEDIDIFCRYYLKLM